MYLFGSPLAVPYGNAVFLLEGKKQQKTYCCTHRRDCFLVAHLVFIAVTHVQQICKFNKYNSMISFCITMLNTLAV